MIDQTTHERQVSVSVSTLAIASVAHPEENPLSSPNVSYWYKYVLAVTDIWQAQESTSGIFAKAQNVCITGGSFTVVSLCCWVYDFGTNFAGRIISIFSLPMQVESR